MVTKMFSKSFICMVIAASCGGAMASTGKFTLNTALLDGYGFSVDPVGAASFASGVLSLATGSVNSQLASFSSADGFEMNSFLGGGSVTGFQLSATGILSGVFNGSILGGNYNFSGALMAANSLQELNGVFVASGFAISNSFRSYLTGQGLSNGIANALGTLVTSAEVPGLATAVPEPSTYAMMALGLVGIGALVKRRRFA